MNNAERAMLQRTSTAAMPDWCNVTTNGITTTNVPCRYQDAPPEPVFISGAQTPGALFDLPREIGLNRQSTITLIERMGQPQSVLYKAVAAPTQFVSMQQIAVRRNGDADDD